MGRTHCAVGEAEWIRALADGSGKCGWDCRQHVLQLGLGPKEAAVVNIFGSLPNFVVPTELKDHQHWTAEAQVVEVEQHHAS